MAPCGQWLVASDCGMVARGFGLRPSGRIVRTVRRGRPKGRPVVGIPHLVP